MPPAAPPTPAAHRARRLRLPRRSPRASAVSPEEEAPPEGEAQRRLFSAADEAAAGVAEVRAALRRLRALHSEELAASRSDEILELRSRMVADTAATSAAASRVRSQIEALARRRYAEDSALERMRSNLAVSLEIRFRDAMSDFAELRAALRGDHEAVLSRRYAAVAGRAPSADELHALEEASHNAAQALLQRACAGAAEPGLAAQVVDEVAARHDAVLDLEKSMAQLTQYVPALSQLACVLTPHSLRCRRMFLDMATLIDAQGDTVDSSESQVAKSAAYGERGRAAVASARRHQRAARRKSIFVMLGVAVLAALIAVAIAVPAALSRLRGK